MLSPALRWPKSLWSYNPIPTGCVLYLPLWHPNLSGSPFNSIDPYGHTCTVTGATYSSAGRTFDGTNDVITCGTNPALLVTNITAEVWIYAATTMADFEIVFGNTASNLEAGWAFLWNGNIIRFYIKHYSNNTAYIALTPDDKWHHIIGTYDGATIKIFHDMVQGTDDTYGTGMDYTGATGVMLGSPITGVNAYRFSSIIGEAGLYNRVLSASEMTHIYNATKWRYQ